ADRIEAQYARLSDVRHSASAHLGIDRIHRDSLYFDQQVAPRGSRAGEFKINQCVIAVDGAIIAIADGFHVISSGKGRIGGIASRIAPEQGGAVEGIEGM